MFKPETVSCEIFYGEHLQDRHIYYTEGNDDHVVCYSNEPRATATRVPTCEGVCRDVGN